MNYKRKLDKKKIGLNLYKLFASSNHTYDAVAEFLMLKTSRVIYDWFDGKKMPSTENLWNLAEFFNVHIEDILS